MKTQKSNKATINAKITISQSVERLKNVKFTSGKPEEIKKADFILSF